MGLGLGKTVSALTAFDVLRTLGDARAALVLAPMRVATLTWPNEIEKWGHLRHLRVANLRTKDGWNAMLRRAADIYTLNYESIPRLCSQYLENHEGPPAFDTVIYDESTRLKSHNGARAKMFRRQLSRISRRWALTGTPTPNSLLELFNQIRMLDEGARLGNSFDRFKRAYFRPLDYMEYNWEILPGAEQKIYGKIHDIALTLQTHEYSDVPEPEVHDVYVPLPDAAKEQYRTLQKELLLSMGDGELPVVAPSAAVLVNKLLQVTGGTVYREDRSVVALHDAKIVALKKLLTKDRTPALVSCNYLHEQARILHALPGSRPWPKKESEQQEFLASWNRNRIPILVADPRSIGHGLNLQVGGAHHVVWYGLPWSRELYDQFNARLVRRGQVRAVQIYRILCPDTVDDAVAETLRQRDEGQRALLDTLTNIRRMLQ